MTKEEKDEKVNKVWHELFQELQSFGLKHVEDRKDQIVEIVIENSTIGEFALLTMGNKGDFPQWRRLLRDMGTSQMGELINEGIYLFAYLMTLAEFRVLKKQNEVEDQYEKQRKAIEEFFDEKRKS